MDNGKGDQPIQRAYTRRVGVVLLNLIVPGLGLLRVGCWRAAILFFLAPSFLAVLLTSAIGFIPITSLAAAIGGLIVGISLQAAIYIMPAFLTWRESRFYVPPQRWARWYNLVLAAAAASALSLTTIVAMRHFIKPFRAASESMAPTLERGDKLFADMRWRGPVRRGALILFWAPDCTIISRVAAVAGDRIAVRNGVPVINGQSARQSIVGRVTVLTSAGRQPASVLMEQLPGEASTHRVLDSGTSELDEAQEVTVPPGHVFVLGDNRDRAADSRVPVEYGGSGMVPVTAILGRPMYISWSSDHSRIGTRLDQ